MFAAKLTLPVTSPRATRGHIPGWSEDIDPKRRLSLFWHSIWVDCGRPRSGHVADIMRKTRLAYHYAIRNSRRHDRDRPIVNHRFAEAILENKSRDFSGEVKRIRRSGSIVAAAASMVQHAPMILQIHLLNNIRTCTPVSLTFRLTWLVSTRRLRPPLCHMIVDVLLLLQRLLTPCIS